MGNCFTHSDSKKNKVIETCVPLSHKSCNHENIKDFSLNGIKCNAKVVDIYDGDTFRLVFYLEGKLVKFKVRGYGYNCPEMRPSKNHPDRKEEIEKAIYARNRLLELVTDAKIDLHKNYEKKEIQNILYENKKLVFAHFGNFDKYGRVLTTLYTKEKAIHDILIEEHLAVPYYGEGRNKLSLTI
jgi:endonuclease YncB( thermonuclease family)